MPRLALSLVALAALAIPLAGGAFAQGNPTTADQIIEGLRPRSGATRGLRSVPSTSEGLRAVPSDAGATTPGAKPAAGDAVTRTAPPPPPDYRPSVNLTVQFATGSAELTPAARRSLNDLGRALSSHELADYRFLIEGHTDTVGSRAYNLDLSERRAQAARQYLIENFGIDASRLEAVGRGEDDLLIRTPDQTPEARNRRVRIVNLDG